MGGGGDYGGWDVCVWRMCLGLLVLERGRMWWVLCASAKQCETMAEAEVGLLLDRSESWCRP